MFRAIHFNKLIPCCINIDNFNGMSVRTYGESYQDVKGKTMYLPLTSDTDAPNSYLARNDLGRHVWPKTGVTLFISKESKVPRAILRNSDYKITIDPDKASYIVIPETTEFDVPTRESQIAYIVKNSNGYVAVYYFYINCPWMKSSTPVDEDTTNKIKELIQNEIELSSEEKAEFYYFEGLPKKNIYFIKNCLEIEDFLTGNKQYKIIFDTRLRIESAVGVNLDTLQIWEKMMSDGKEMVAKAIIGSDWQKYPCTISAFVEKYRLRLYGGEQMKYVLRSIDFDYYYNNETFRKDMEVQPEDWNLLQDWLMFKSGVGPDGGFHKTRQSDMKFARTATCVKPVRITEPTLFQEIEARLKI